MAKTKLVNDGAEALKYFMHKHDVTARALSLRVGMGVNSVYNILNGHRSMSTMTALCILNKMGEGIESCSDIGLSREEYNEACTLLEESLARAKRGQRTFFRTVPAPTVFDEIVSILKPLDEGQMTRVRDLLLLFLN